MTHDPNSKKPPCSEGNLTTVSPNLIIEDFRQELDECDISPEKEKEFFETICRIMSMMVDLGWGVDSVQMLLPDVFEKAGQESVKLIDMDHSQSFNDCAESRAEESEA